MVEKQIAFVVDPVSTSGAVWGALSKHLQYAHFAGAKVFVFVHESAIDRMPQTDSRFFVIGYQSWFSLARRLRSFQLVFFPNALAFVRTVVMSPELRQRSILWVQGLLSEESYIRNRSHLRRLILSLIEKTALRSAGHLIFVSHAMREYYERALDKKLPNCSVIPCLTDLKLINSAPRREVFVYLGGMSPWQKIDEILLAFAEVQRNMPTAQLLVLTQDVEKFERVREDLLPRIGALELRVMSCKSTDQVQEQLNQCKYGFLLRDDIPANRVAAPIKFLEYIRCGVMPIISPNVGDYSAAVEQSGIGLIYRGAKALTEEIRQKSQPPHSVAALGDFFGTATEYSQSYCRLFDCHLK